MFNALAALSRGDVVACGASTFVVHQVTEDGGLELVRAMTSTGLRHRADVRPHNWSDIAEAGLPLQDLVIRCVVIIRENPSGFIRLGQVSRSLRERIRGAVARDREARCFEATAPVRSTLDARRAALRQLARPDGRAAERDLSNPSGFGFGP